MKKGIIMILTAVCAVSLVIVNANAKKPQPGGHEELTLVLAGDLSGIAEAPQLFNNFMPCTLHWVGCDTLPAGTYAGTLILGNLKKSGVAMSFTTGNTVIGARGGVYNREEKTISFVDADGGVDSGERLESFPMTLQISW
jgi:hypothetical protein